MITGVAIVRAKSLWIIGLAGLAVIAAWWVFSFAHTSVYAAHGSGYVYDPAISASSSYGLPAIGGNIPARVGDTIRINDRTTNNGSSAGHRQSTVIQTQDCATGSASASGDLTWVDADWSYPVYEGTVGCYKTWVWSNAPGIPPGNSRTRFVEFRIEPGVSVGDTLCFFSYTSPHRPGVDYMFTEEVCFVVVSGSGGVTPFDYNPSISADVANAYPGDTITITSTTVNNGSGAGPTFDMGVYPTNTVVATQNLTSSAPVTWSSLPGLGASSSVSRNTTFTVSGTARNNDVVCFRSYASPSNGTNNGGVFTVTVNRTDSPPPGVCVTISVRFYEYVPDVSGVTNSPDNTTVYPGESFNVITSVANIGNGNGPAHTIGLVPRADTLQNVIDYTTSSFGTGVTYNDPPLARSATGPTHTETFSVVNSPPDGTQFCFWATVDPSYGREQFGAIVYPPIRGASPPTEYCFTVGNVPWEVDDPILNISTPGGSFPTPGESVTVDVIVCNASGSGPTTGAAGAGIINITLRDGDLGGNNTGVFTTAPSGSAASVAIQAGPTNCWTQTVTGTVPPATPPGGTFCLSIEVLDSRTSNPAITILRGQSDGPNIDNGVKRDDICITVSNSAYFKIYNNDVLAGAGFGTSPFTGTGDYSGMTRTVGGVPLGAAAEFAAVALGAITDAGTQSVAESTALAFANDAGGPGNFGAAALMLPDYFTALDLGNTLVPFGNISGYVSDASLNGQFYIDASSFPGSAVDIGTSVSGTQVRGQKTLIVDGVVRIRNSITYTGGVDGNGPGPTFTVNANGVVTGPSLTIIARDGIHVQSRAQQLDGTYITPGLFATCSNAPNGVATSICSNYLEINGAVIAQRLQLQRTTGSLNALLPGGDRSSCSQAKLPTGTDEERCASETFWFSSEAYVNPPVLGSNGGGGSSVYGEIQQIVDLPPTF